MYRSIANFGIWCTSPAPVSPLHRSPTAFTEASAESLPAPKIIVTGSIPDFNESMIRQRVTPHGVTRAMEPETDIPALNISADEICVIHSGPTKRWLLAKQRWDVKYAKQRRRVQLAWGREYIEAQSQGFLGGDLVGEAPPPSALAGRPSIQMAMVESHRIEQDKRKNLATWMWSNMGGKEDKVVEEGIMGPATGDHAVPASDGT